MRNELHDAGYWDERYLNHHTKWDIKQVSPPLRVFIDLLTDKSIKILIPGCGNAYEAQYLADQGFKNVTILDISKVLTNRLRRQFKNTGIQILNQDFFEHEGRYDLILEQTFFCALLPSDRKAYVHQCYRLLNPKGIIAGLLFNKKQVAEEPPYIASDEEYRKLFQPFFHFRKYENCTTSIPPRLGAEVWFEFQKLN